jgi:hypothetical protein
MALFDTQTLVAGDISRIRNARRNRGAIHRHGIDRRCRLANCPDCPGTASRLVADFGLPRRYDATEIFI